MRIVFNFKGSEVRKTVRTVMYGGRFYNEESDVRTEGSLRPVIMLKQPAKGDEEVPCYWDDKVGYLFLPEEFVRRNGWLKFGKTSRPVQESHGWYGVQWTREAISFRIGGELHTFSSKTNRVVGFPDLRILSMECDFVGTESAGVKVNISTKLGKGSLPVTITYYNKITVDAPEPEISREVEKILRGKPSLIWDVVATHTVVIGMEKVCKAMNVQSDGDVIALLTAYWTALARMAPSVRADVEKAVGDPVKLKEVLGKWFRPVEPTMINGIPLKPKQRRFKKEKRLPWIETEQGREMTQAYRERGEQKDANIQNA